MQLMPAPSAGATCTLCSTHGRPPCSTRKQLRRDVQTYGGKGHHAQGYLGRQPLSSLCEAHSLLACARDTLMQRGVRHCWARGHHKVCTPARRAAPKRPAPVDMQLSKRPCKTQSPARTYAGHARSPHIPFTPPAPKRQRPRSACPPPRKVVGLIPGSGISGGGLRQPCVKGILSGEMAKLSRPWRPPRCREHHQLWHPQYTHNIPGNLAVTGSLG